MRYGAEIFTVRWGRFGLSYVQRTAQTDKRSCNYGDFSAKRPKTSNFRRIFDRWSKLWGYTHYARKLRRYTLYYWKLWVKGAKFGKYCFWGKNRLKKQFFGQNFRKIFDFSWKSPIFVNHTISPNGMQNFSEIRIFELAVGKSGFAAEAITEKENRQGLEDELG